MTPRARRSLKTAAQLMAELNEDPEYQRRASEADAEFHRRAIELNEAEAPVLEDLRQAGVHVTSVWDLVSTEDPYPEALPILVRHLERGGYPDRVMESMARAIAVEPAGKFWETLKILYLNARGAGEEEGLAVALAATARAKDVDDLAELIGDKTRGESRVLFLEPLLKVGGATGLRLVEELKGDELLGREAAALLRTRRR